MMQGKQAIAPSFCLKTITTGMAEAFWGMVWGFFIKHCRTISDMAGICRGRYSIVGSVLWVCLGQQRQPFLPQNELILVYFDTQWERWGGFPGKQQCSVFTYFRLQVQGCNKHSSWQAATREVWKSCFIQEALGFKCLINVSFEDYCAICSDTLW